ncbi:alpha/beta fold hydrolase [Nostoc sp.]
MILKTYSRIFTDNLDGSLDLLKKLVGREPDFRVPFRDMEVVTIGDFCILAGPADSIKPFLGAVGPVIVDDLAQTQAALEKAGAEIIAPITEGPTGWNIFSRNPDGIVIEWVQWRPDIWERVKNASNNTQILSDTPASPSAISSFTPSLLPGGFTSAVAEVNGVTIHYVIGGTGDPLVLVHGWPQTWYEWHGIMPPLAERFTVIAVDLRGAGGSSKPAPSAGYDARTMAEDIHQLIHQLGFNSIRILGHDIGLLVAYAYAAAYPTEVHKLVLLDGFLAGIEPMWSQFRADPRSWVFSLHETKELPEQLTAGKEREYLTWFYTNQAYRKGAFSEAEIDEYVRAYSAPGAMSASFEWFRAFKTDIEQNQASSRTKLTMPVLALGGEKLTGHIMVPMAQVVADDVRGGSVPECGHWMAEEKPDYLLDQLNDFLP